MNTTRFGIFITLICASGGGLLFASISAPLPWILGSITAVVVSSKFGLPLEKIPRVYVNIARVVIGLAIGAQFSPQMLENLGNYITSLAFLPIYVALVTFAGWFYFHHFMKLDTRTAFLCSTPGGIAELVIVGEDIKANVAQLALIQGIRILVVVYTLPFFAGNLKGMDVGALTQFTPTLSESSITNVLLLAIIGLSGWFCFHKLRLSGAPIIGPMIFAAIFSVAELLPQEPPDELFKLGQILLGASIGAVFFKYSLIDMGKTTVKSLGFLVILAVISIGIAATVSQVTDFTFVSALLAYAPGGQAESSIISLALNENTSYVAVHHLCRLFIIVSLIPIFARRVFR